MNPSGGHTATILIVEDYDDSREMYAAFLSGSGYGVIEARNGAEAIDRAREAIPDLIVMDLSLPEMDGWEATRRLKLDPSTRHIPVVALTGHALERHSQEAHAAGCDAFLAKPCLPDRLHETVRRLLAPGGSGVRKVPLAAPRPQGATGS